MFEYVIKRIVGLIPVLIGVTLLVFLIMQLTPGDPVRVLLGEMGQGVSQEQLETIRRDLGLDRPLPEQYFLFLSRALQGDMGRSFRSNRPVAAEVAARFPYTLLLAISALVFAIMVGVPAGILSATRPYSRLDSAVTFICLLGVSIPVFWLGLLLMLFFALHLRWLPASGSGSWRHLVMPAMTIGLSSIAFITRMTRSSMLEVLRDDYIRTARSKGASRTGVIWKHAMRNAAIPIVTTVGLQFGYLLGGAVLTETVFAWPGIGRLTVQAIIARDLPVVQGCILYVALAFTLVNLLVDLTYALLNPRIRYN